MELVNDTGIWLILDELDARCLPKIVFLQLPEFLGARLTQIANNIVQYKPGSIAEANEKFELFSQLSGCCCSHGLLSSFAGEEFLSEGERSAIKTNCLHPQQPVGRVC